MRAATVAAGALLAVSQAHAADDESIPGAACQQQFDSSTALFAHLAQGAGYNNTNASMTVSCPIQRDSPNTTSGIWAAAYVTNPTGLTTTCTMYSTSLDASVIDSETVNASSAGWQALYFTNVGVSSGWTIYNLKCTLPAKGFINAYYVYEY